MRHTKVIVAIVMAIMLLGGVLAMLPKAAAQAAPVNLEHNLRVFFTDGSSTTVVDTTPFATVLQLTGNQGKTIDRLEFRAFIYNQAIQPMTVNSVTGSTFKISVLTPNGFVNILTTGADTTPQKLFGIDDTKWQVFFLSVPAASFDSAIGSRTSDIASQIRFTSTGTMTANIKIGSAAAKNYIAFPATAVYPMTAKSTGGIDPGPCTTNCSEQDPSGIIYYKVSIQRSIDGLWVQYIGATQTQTFNLFVTGCNAGVNCVDFKAIKYEKWVKMDNDVYNMPNKITYDNPGATNNYGIYVNGQIIPFTRIDTLQSKGTDNYIVLEMQALEADIIPKLDDLGPIGTGGDHMYSGTLDFLHSDATMTVASPTQSYPIDIPRQTVTVNIGGLANPDNPDPCDFDALGTDCEPDPDPVGLPFGLTLTHLGIGAAVLFMIAGVAVLVRKKK